MSLTLAITRGALDIAHGMYRGLANWFGNLWDRIFSGTGVSLTNGEISDLVSLTETSRLAANRLWAQWTVPFDVPIAQPPYFGTPTGEFPGRYQVKIISSVFGNNNALIEKAPFYMEFIDIPDKISIEEYIRRFWEGAREFGNDTIGTTFVDIGIIKNVPIMLVRRD